MKMYIHPVFIQAFYYMIVLVLGMGCISFFMRGFFWKYVKVRMSFGRLILVKVKSINRDYYSVGSISDGFLLYKAPTGEKRIDIKEVKNPIYRSLAVNWVDVDERTNGVCCPDYSTITGFDAVKYSDLYIRCLYKPTLNDTKEKIMFALLIVIGIAVAVTLVICWTEYGLITQLVQNSVKGVVTPAVI